MLMDIRRTILYVALGIVGLLLWLAWQKDHKTQPEVNAQQQTSSQTPISPSNFVPQQTNMNAAEQSPSTAPQAAPTANTGLLEKEGATSSIIKVKTDVLDVSINSNNGNIINAQLLKYPVSVDEPHNPITVLTNNPADLYIAQHGLLRVVDGKQEPVAIHYQNVNNVYEMKEGDKNLKVQLVGNTDTGQQITQTYTFKPHKYSIVFSYTIKNTSNQAWNGLLYQQLTRRDIAAKSGMGRSYSGASISSPDKPYEKLSYSKLRSNNINRTFEGGWVAMQQPYFLTTWIPNASEENHYYSHVTVPPGGDGKHGNIYTLGYFAPELLVAPGDTHRYKSTFYVGPELTEPLKKLAYGLDLTIDYGWLWFLSKFIFWLMDKVHTMVGNWGWSIIIVTLIIKIAFYWFSAKSYISMAKMRELQPRLQALKDRFGDDKQALTQATMDFYRKEKVSPMSGCLPMIIQVPVFIALYYVLIESVQLRQAPFIFWIKDLSIRDPYFVLPILMGLSMFLQQRLSPPPPDPTQAKVMMLLPVIFTIFFLSFPAGLVLYWLVNNCASVLQQWYIMRKFHAKTEQKKTRKKNRS